MSDPEAERSRRRKGLISVVVSALLLAFLYGRLDVRQVGQVLLGAHPLGLLFSVAGILPLTLLRAARFLWVAPPGAVRGLAEALRLTLIASTLNIFAPAKAGDLVKAHFVATRGDISAGGSVAVVIYERLCDVFGLMFWCVLSWAIAQPRVPGLGAPFWWLLGLGGAISAVLVLSTRTADVLRSIATDAASPTNWRRFLAIVQGWPDFLHALGGRRPWIVLFSLVLWGGHLVQIWTFTVALSAPVPFLVCVSLSAVALMAGQLPLTIAGIGARDLTLVVLMTGYLPRESAAGVGILIATRALVPALLGVPFTWPYLSSMLRDVRSRS
jgi:uncharacterized membrane protein YbhN (UPF0104 family)